MMVLAASCSVISIIIMRQHYCSQSHHILSVIIMYDDVTAKIISVCHTTVLAECFCRPAAVK